ncbi:MAG TPA: hypothetical protein VNT26_04895 [Candidatus Sulfotelmatobacter sp.]|nr:hypothetical protein [Candidatus Sulfotelmatobacter sp.]HWI55776.1 hypothetical protein [Bacillota bacterium]
MRILLRHTRTNLYLLGLDRWTEEADYAFDFRFIDQALQFIATWNLQEVEVAFAFADSQQIQTVSLEAVALRQAA